MNFEKSKVIPTVETPIFTESEAHFAIAEVSPSELSDMSEFDGAAELRAKTYLNSGFITESELNDDGTELDLNDERSFHFLVFERAAIDGLARVVGNMRLVMKTADNPAPLPVEEFFPDYFQQPAAHGSAEVSRLISRHENQQVQSFVKWPMFIAGYKQTRESNSGPVYGLLEPRLVRQLRMQGVPMDILAEARDIEEINARKQPVMIDLDGLGEFIDKTGDLGVDVTGGRVSYFDAPSVTEKDAA